MVILTLGPWPRFQCRVIVVLRQTTRADRAADSAPRAKKTARPTEVSRAAVSPYRLGLEVQLHRQLDQPRRGEAGDLAERRAARDTGSDAAPVAVVQDIEEVGTELHLKPLTQLELPAEGNVEIDLAGSIESVAPEIAEHAGPGATRVEVAVDEAGARKRRRVEIFQQGLLRGIYLVRQHRGAVQTLGAERDILAGSELYGVAGVQAGQRGELPVLGNHPGSAGAHPGAEDHQRRVEVVTVVEPAIAALTRGAVERVLVNRARQFSREVPRADAVAPGVSRKQREVVGHAVLRLQQEAVILGVGAVVGLLDIAVVLPGGPVEQIGYAALIRVRCGCGRAGIDRIVDVRRAQIGRA